MNTRFAPRHALRVLFSGTVVTALGFLAFVPSAASAAAVIGWTSNNGVTNDQLDTASPVLGDGTANSANSQQIYASTAAPYTLTVGYAVTLSGSVTFSGMSAPQADQFRFGLYDVNGKSTASGWLGYFATNTGTPTSSQTYSRLWERDNPNTFSYGSGSGATLAGSASATTGTNTSFVTGSYDFSQTITRTAAGLDITWSIVGANGNYSVYGTAFDSTPQTYAFNRVGVFIGNGLNASQVSFSNIDVTFAAVPEPSSWAAITACLALGAACLRRRVRS